MQAENFDIVDYVLTHTGQLIGIEADTGVGKTSLLTYILLEIYNRTKKQEEERLKINADILRNMGYTKVRAGQHCIYTNYENYLFIPTRWQKFCHLAKYKFKTVISFIKYIFKRIFCKYDKLEREIIGNKYLTAEEKELLLEDYKFAPGAEFEPLKAIKPYSCELQDLRVPNAELPYKHFENGSIIAISEKASEDFNNQDGTYDRYMHQFMKKKRHNKITVLMETQKFSRSMKWLRENINTLFYIKKRYNYKHNKIEYYLYLYEGSSMVEKYGINQTAPLTQTELKKISKTKIVDDRDKIRYCRVSFKKDIYKYYNPEEHIEDFLVDLEEYDHSTWDDSEKSKCKQGIQERACVKRERDNVELISSIRKDVLKSELKNKLKIEAQKQLKNKNIKAG